MFSNCLMSNADHSPPPDRQTRINPVAGAALLVSLAGVWLTSGESPDVERSRALRLGMTSAEVESVMGRAHVVQSAVTQNGLIEWLLFGRALFLKGFVTESIGMKRTGGKD